MATRKATALAGAALLSLAACGGEPGNDPESDPPQILDVGRPATADGASDEGEAPEGGGFDGAATEADSVAPSESDGALGETVEPDTGSLDDGATESASERCRPPVGTSGSPGNVSELLSLINELPKPTTVACFVESLDRPLELYLTRSSFSAQPADGARNPRTFINIGNLSVSIVPGGRSSTLLEFGYRLGNDRSVKGEVQFPVVRPLTPETMVRQIEAGFGSKCGACHTREGPAQGDHYAGAFESNVIIPSAFYEVELESLRAERDACDEALEPERCDILQGLFDHGEVRRTALWPAD